MAKKNNWYFRGYESRRALGRGGVIRTELVYTGDWYFLPPGTRRPLAVWLTLLTAVATVLCMAMNMFPSEGGRLPYVGGPCLITLAPLLFVWIRLISFLTAGERWTYRRYYCGYRSFGIWIVLASIPAAVALLGELVWICLHISRLRSEALYLAAAAVSACCLAAASILKHRHPVQTEAPLGTDSDSDTVPE